MGIQKDADYISVRKAVIINSLHFQTIPTSRDKKKNIRLSSGFATQREICGTKQRNIRFRVFWRRELPFQMDVNQNMAKAVADCFCLTHAFPFPTPRIQPSTWARVRSGGVRLGLRQACSSPLRSACCSQVATV